MFYESSLTFAKRHATFVDNISLYVEQIFFFPKYIENKFYMYVWPLKILHQTFLDLHTYVCVLFFFS